MVAGRSFLGCDIPFVASSSLFGVIGGVCSDLSDFALICGDGVLGCVSFPAAVLGGPLLALDAG